MKSLKKSVILAIAPILYAFPAFADSWYQTDKELKIGERDGVCEVVAQLNLGHGSQPLIIDRAQDICQEAYKKDINNGFPLKVLMNGDTQIVNCMICASEK